MTHESQISQKFSALRDRARLQVHLLSLDAHEIWRSLEGELSTLEEQLSKSGGSIIASTAHKVSELVQRTEAFLEHQLIGELTLASPAQTAMTVGLRTCTTTDRLNVAARIMWEEDCGAVPVVDQLDQPSLLLGIVTDRDLAMACYTQGKSPEQLSVTNAMSKLVHSVRPDAPLSEAIATMKLYKVRRIPVLTESGHLLGLISVSDLLRGIPAQRQGSALEAALVDALIAISAKSRASNGHAVAAE
jgi:CBS domain-containing protein